MNEYYYEIFKSKKYTVNTDWSNYDYESMGIIEAANATEALNLIKETVKSANELSKESLYKYQPRNLREI